MSTEEDAELTATFEALANPFRLGLLRRLAQPSFSRDLERDLDITRQALRRHLEILRANGLVEERSARRGALPATAYIASPGGLFAFKEKVSSIALPVDPRVLGQSPTLETIGDRRIPMTMGAGLLMVHGDVPGRWFPIGGPSQIVGRDPRGGIGLPYDPFASARHAHLFQERSGWRVTDLHSRNGTQLNFERLAAGETRDLRPGDVLTIGRTRLVFQEGR